MYLIYTHHAKQITYICLNYHILLLCTDSIKTILYSRKVELCFVFKRFVNSGDNNFHSMWYFLYKKLNILQNRESISELNSRSQEQ